MGLGKINGKEILSINVWGVEQDYAVLHGIKSFKEAYEEIKNLKAFDRANGLKDKYMLELETEDAVYGLYTLRKYKNRWIVK